MCFETVFAYPVTYCITPTYMRLVSVGILTIGVTFLGSGARSLSVADDHLRELISTIIYAFCMFNFNL